jgi:hypothetical protein
MRRAAVHGPRCAGGLGEEADVTVPAPPADECREAGREAAGPKDRAADQLLSGLTTFEAVGWAPDEEAIQIWFRPPST